MASFKICGKCYSQIFSEDLRAAYFWVEICKCGCLNDGFLSLKLEHGFDRELDILEERQYIKTHETNARLIISLQGFIMDGEFMHAYCLDVENHGVSV